MPDPLPEDESPVPMSADALLPLVYQQLRHIARRERRSFGGGGETLRTTALIHETYLRMAGAGFGSRGHFLGYAARAMRNILIDRARAQVTAKHGGETIRVDLSEAESFAVADDAQLLAVHDALQQLALVSERLVAVVECRFFAGYNEEETAEALGISTRSVQRAWVMARAWLKREMHGA